MHNLHLVVIKADSPKDACGSVETIIEDWGNENNWRTICGCVSEDNEVFINDKGGRCCPDDDTNTIEKINTMVKGWFENYFYAKDGEKYITGLQNGTWNKEEKVNWWSVKKYAELQYQLIGIDRENFNVLTNSFYDWEFDEYGVTQLDDNGEKTYVVFVDMHS